MPFKPKKLDDGIFVCESTIKHNGIIKVTPRDCDVCRCVKVVDGRLFYIRGCKTHYEQQKNAESDVHFPLDVEVSTYDDVPDNAEVIEF